jgi:hypothetical protein
MVLIDRVMFLRLRNIDRLIFNETTFRVRRSSHWCWMNFQVFEESCLSPFFWIVTPAQPIAPIS